jgi:glycosyltransferase involved in cell wall biosynthesis
MACGCPTAVARATSLPEVCGDASAYFDPRSAEDIGRAIVEVVERPEGYAERGIARAAAFTWEACARAHDAVYADLVAGV